MNNDPIQPQNQNGPAQPESAATPASQVTWQPESQSANTVDPTMGQQGGQQPTQPTVAGFGLPPQQFTNQTTNSAKKKKLVLVSAVGLVVLLLGSSAAAYFGYLVPNKPENIWATAMDRSAAGYDKLVAYSDSTKDLTSATFKGDYKLTGQIASDGTFEGSFDEKNMTMKADIGAVTTRVNLDMRMIDSPASSNPDVYFKVSGLKGLGALMGDSSGMLDQFENQWYVADHTLLDTLTSTVDEDVASTDISQLSDEDINAILKAVGEVNREYLLTTDESKRVLTVAKNVGKETLEGRSVYHFEVGLDKQHTKDYLKAMVDKLEETPVKKLLDGKKLADAVSLDELLAAVDEYKTSDTADVFVDTETKLIHTVRFVDKENNKNYLDISLPYTGGDEVPMSIAMHFDDENDKGVFKVTSSVNMKTNVVNAGFTIDSESGGDTDIKGNAKMTITLGKDKVTVQKPSGAKSINELLAPFLGSGLSEDTLDSGDDSFDASDLLGGRLSI